MPLFKGIRDSNGNQTVYRITRDLRITGDNLHVQEESNRQYHFVNIKMSKEQICLEFYYPWSIANLVTYDDNTVLTISLVEREETPYANTNYFLSREGGDTIDANT